MPTPAQNPAVIGAIGSHTDLGAILAAGVAFGQKEADVLYIPGDEGHEDGIPFVFLNGQAVGLQGFMPPRLGKMSPSFTDALSLAWYINKYKNDDTVIFATFDEDGGKFTVIFDYPGVGKVSRKEHIASFEVETTPEWDAILAINKEFQSQTDFCEFVERWPKLFAKPTGTDMLEMARYIDGKREGAFSFGVRLSNGDRQIIWKEQTQINVGATGGGEPTPVPERLLLRLPLYEGTEPVEIETLLRLQVSGGRVAFKIEVRDMDRIVRDAMKEMSNTIRDETSVPILMGNANG